MSDNEPCFICRGQAVHAIAVPVGEDAEFIDVYSVHVCSACFAFHEEIADQIRQHIADRQHDDRLGLRASGPG
jgi:hypothetical protein